jgi:hypothetical protein
LTQDASGPDQAAANTDASNAAESFGAAQGDLGDYMSNVNSALAAGNPFESKDYLTQQNLATSGAMNSANSAEKEALDQGVARTGTNSAAIAGTEASSARQGQRDLTNFNANRDTQNETTWLGQQDKLLGDQQAGAQTEAGLYSSGVSGQAENLKSMTTADDAYNQLEDEVGQQAAQAAAGLAA